MAPLLELHQVTHHNPWGEPLLQDLSWQVHGGDRWGIIGPSGSGKSTLLRLCNHLIRAHRGQVRYQGRELAHHDPLVLRRQVVLIPQEPKFLGQSVQAAIAYPLTLANLPPQEIQQRVTYWCDRLQIPQAWQEKNELELSLGQRQWVTLARGLVMNPTILLLDEPTSALDLGRSQLLWQLLQEHEITTAIVSHQLELLSEVVHHLLFLQDGKAIAQESAPHINWSHWQTTIKTPQPDQEW